MIEKAIKEIQYIFDDPSEYSIKINENYYQEDYEIKAKKLNLTTRGLRVSKNLFPGLYKAIENVSQKLDIKDEISFYLMADNTLNAYCIPMTKNESVVVINSSLVELLNQSELEYIIGHEIGHHLFSHMNYPPINVENNNNIGLRRLSQAAEISVDRIGLYCNNDINACINCMMKIQSGLKSPHINFDHNEFINHLKTIVDLNGDKNQIYQTHPLIYVRAKALIIFSESQTYLKSINQKTFKHTKTEMDNFVNTLISSSEGNVFEENQIEEFEEIKLWAKTILVISKNKWTNVEKEILVKYFENQDMDKIDNFIKESKKSHRNPKNEIEKRFSEVVNNSLTRSKNNKLISEIKIFCLKLVNNHSYEKNILLEELSKISNIIGYDKAISLNK